MTGSDTELDRLFAAARAARPDPSPDLVARVLADAYAAQPMPAAPPLAPPARRPGVWQALASAFGGMGAVAGMGTATLAGLWLGFAQPEPLANLSATLWAESSLGTVELIPGSDDFWTDEVAQ